MLGVTILILILVDIKIRLSDLLMFAGTLILSIKSRRQVSLVLIMGMPLLAKFISSFFEKYDNSLCKMIKELATSIVGIIVVVYSRGCDTRCSIVCMVVVEIVSDIVVFVA